jgi:hypothetical protein
VKDILIEEFTKLLIKQSIDDAEKGKATYVKKTRVYKDLIKLIKRLNI